jgi:hypothetical protein
MLSSQIFTEFVKELDLSIGFDLHGLFSALSTA